MGQIRVTLERFAQDPNRELAELGRNDEILLESDGKVVARVRPEPEPVDWALFLEDLKKIPPLDDDFKRHVLEVIEERNKPAEDIDWEF